MEVLLLSQKTDPKHFNRFSEKYRKYVGLFSTPIEKVYILSSLPADWELPNAVPLEFIQVSNWRPETGINALLQYARYILSLFVTASRTLLKQRQIKYITHYSGHVTVGFIAAFLSILFRKSLIIRLTEYSDVSMLNVSSQYSGIVTKTFQRAIQWSEKFVLSHATHIILLSDFMKPAFTSYLHKATVIPQLSDNVLRYAKAYGISETAQSQDPAEIFELLFVGRLNVEKGVFVLVEAIAALPNVRCTFIGEGPLRAELEQAYPASKLQFLGNIPHTEVFATMQRSDAFCLPSYAESLSNVLIEAAMMRLPIIASNISSLSSQVPHLECAYLCDPGDVEQFRTAIELFQQDRTLTNRLASNAFIKTQRLFDQDQMQADMMAIYS